MRPILFYLGRRPFYSYPALVYLGLVLGVATGNAVAGAHDLDGAPIFVATLVLLIAALVGARLCFVAGHWSTYGRDLARIWRRREGGAVLLGGLPLALAASVPLLGALGLPFGTFWDVATFTILVAMVVGRFGCLLHGCCAGRPTDSRFGVVLPNPDGVWRRRIPVQLLEAGWAVVLLAGAIVTYGRLPFPGALFAGGLGAYGIGRLVLESAREHVDGDGSRLRTQVPAASCVALSLAIFAFAAGRSAPW